MAEDHRNPQVALANERTFLAWIRTSLALTATGAAIVALAPPVHRGWLLASGAMFVVLGIVAGAQAWVGWRHTDRDTRAGRGVAPLRIGPYLTAGVIVATVTLLIGAVLA
ncbi:YidH family protein [Demequina litorisediminis]|uniref:Membrane protein n=1 Tax=Demequina litorisediminis TaxID=1849022 RepID=A0ABQ6IKV7_9MICO|nr:DUF202 domain-containing protein [Demequina litorisediminis]GMA37304.1 membrane protein [Demequina litorisediminis]